MVVLTNQKIERLLEKEELVLGFHQYYIPWLLTLLTTSKEDIIFFLNSFSCIGLIGLSLSQPIFTQAKGMLILKKSFSLKAFNKKIPTLWTFSLEQVCLA